MPKIADVNPALPIDLNVVGQSPHVMVYRIWVMLPGQAWQKVATGSTADDIADHQSAGPYPEGTKLAYWFGVAGAPSSTWQGLLSISQQGKIVPGGACLEQGTTNAKGAAVREDQVTFV
jgi:hypothetical protein